MKDFFFGMPPDSGRAEFRLFPDRELVLVRFGGNDPSYDKAQSLPEGENLVFFRQCVLADSPARPPHAPRTFGWVAPPGALSPWPPTAFFLGRPAKNFFPKLNLFFSGVGPLGPCAGKKKTNCGPNACKTRTSHYNPALRFRLVKAASVMGFKAAVRRKRPEPTLILISKAL